MYRILEGDVTEQLRTLPGESVHCVVTSPPYWGLRDYGTGTWTGGDPACRHVESEIRTGLGLAALGEQWRGGGHKQGEVTEIGYRDVCGLCGAVRADRQIGLEKTPGEYVERMVGVFREVRRVLRNDGTCWVNMGDSYCSGNRDAYDQVSDNKGKRGTVNLRPHQPFGMKSKDLVGMPWTLALALRDDGWYLRQDIIWAKPNPMPESVHDRCTKAHEYLFLFSKSTRYFYDQVAISEPVTGNAHPRGDGVNPKAHWKTPDGWDTSAGNGGHGMFHKEGREEGYVGYEPKLRHDSAEARKLRANPEAKSVPTEERAGMRPLGAKGSLANPDEVRSARGAAFGRGAGWREAGSPRSKQNESFSAAVSGLVETRNKRSVWTIPEDQPQSEPVISENRKALRSDIESRHRSSIPGGQSMQEFPDGSRNKRSVWTIATQPFPEAHFATYPQKLVEPCILAGTSEYGCCPQCGAPWKREIASTGKENDRDRSNRCDFVKGVTQGGNASGIRSLSGATYERQRAATGGWQPTCKCECADELVPGMVLDPFAGSGTTGVVALRLERAFIGIELNAEYVAMARKRIESDAPLFNTGSRQQRPVTIDEQVELFAEEA